MNQTLAERRLVVERDTARRELSDFLKGRITTSYLLERAEAAERCLSLAMAALQTYGQHQLNCAINVTRHADDSAAYLSEKCTCGFAEALAI